MAFSMAPARAGLAGLSAQRPRSVPRGVAAGAGAGKAVMQSWPGITEPMGYFDPSNFSEQPACTAGEAKRYREAELTHGRVAMLACLGWITAEQWHPLWGGQITGPAYYHFQKVEEVFPQFWELILLGIGICEAYRIGIGYTDPREGGDQLKPDYIPGDLGFDPMNLYPKDPEEQQILKTKELNNGRLAMISIAAYCAQEAVNGKTIVQTLQDFGYFT